MSHYIEYMSSEKKEKIVIVGYGWVGQANALALVKMGYPVWFYDKAENPTIHYTDESETYLEIKRANSIAEVDTSGTWFIVCVGDRVSEEGEQDITLIKSATDALKGIQGSVILRSTVLPQKLHELAFDLYMPEFLHEKNAVDECLNPFYFVLGTKGNNSLPVFAKEWEQRAYKVFRGTPEEASHIKYLSNIWNSIRIAFVNEMGDSIGNPKTKDDVKKIEQILDFVFERKSYLRYGQAFDGHCLPKDTRAYIGASQKDGKNVDLLVGAYTSNEHHKKIQESLKTLPKVFSFWEHDKIERTLLGLLWYKINEVPFIQNTRKDSRFVIDAISRIIPDRSIERVGEIWEEKAQENALYYSNIGTKSAAQVTEDELRRTGVVDYERLVLRDPTIEDLIKSSTPRKVLDFGSGVGRMTEYFTDDFDVVHGVDISKTMIEGAKKRVPKATFSVFDGQVLPYEPEDFDLIFSYQVLQYAPSVSDVERYLKEFYRILKQGGVAKLQLRGGRGFKKWEWLYGVAFMPETAVALAEKDGFTVLDHQVEGIKNVWLTLRK